MPEVKIGVGANVGGVDAAIQKITASMNKLGASVAQNQKQKFEPVDVKLMARDLSLINKQFQQTLALSAQLRNALKATGQSGAQLSQIDFARLSTDPRVAQRMRDRAFLHSVRGTALDPTAYNEVDSNGNIVPPAPPGGGAGGGSGGAGGGGGGRRPRRGGGGGSGGSGGDDDAPVSWWRRRPSGNLGTASALAIGNGIGGTAGNMLTAGIEGGPIGALLAGITSVVGKGMEWAGQGMDQAKARNIDLDTLKRSLGDINVAFSDLSEQSWKFAQGLGMANGEFVKLEGQANAQSGGFYRTPEDLARATRGGADLSRAYGLDPSQGVSFVAGMQRINQRQNNKELALQIAEAISNTAGKATPGEVMQAMQGFASQQNAFNAVNPNLDVFGNAYSDMLTRGDMTADHASSILGQANSSMQRMGGTEASKNFLLQQFGLDPIRAQLRSEGGLFANGLDNQDVSTFMRRRGVTDWDSQNKGPAGSNLAVAMQGLDRAYGGRGQYGYEMELNAVQNMFGLKSLGDAASLANASTSDHNGIAMMLRHAGVSLGDVREGGLQAISAISRANNFDDLDKLYRSGPEAIRNRKDMQPSELAAIDSAEKSGNFQQMQNEMVRALAGKGQEDSVATQTRNIDANISDIKTKIGDALVPMTNTIMQGIIKMAGLGGPDAAASGSGAPYGFGSGPVPVGGNKGIVVRPGGSSAAPGGTTVGGAGNARDMSGHVDNSGDSAAAWANGMYGAMIGGGYSVNSSVVDGMSQLVSMGVDKAHSSAIMASAIRESSMNPAAGHVGSYGLFQFDKTRAADFQRVMGKSLYGSSQHDQIDYMLRSLQKGGEEAGPGAAFLASNAKDAARVFSDKIERPKDRSKEGDIRSGIAGALNDSDIVINLHQTVTTPTGQSRTKTLSTKVQKPTASGSQTQAPYIVVLPPGK